MTRNELSKFTYSYFLRMSLSLSPRTKSLAAEAASTFHPLVPTSQELGLQVQPRQHSWVLAVLIELKSY